MRVIAFLKSPIYSQKNIYQSIKMNQMKKLMFVAFLFLVVSGLQAQKYFTKAAELSFFSEAPMEKIEAFNKTSTCVLDLETGKMEFATLIKGFKFEKALMQEHFNENYMESDKFPKATFKGEIQRYSKIDPSIDKNHEVTVVGKMTIHGVTKDVTAKGTVATKGGKVKLTSNFNIDVADYQIEIPSLVKDKIAKTILIKVLANLEPLKS